MHTFHRCNNSPLFQIEIKSLHISEYYILHPAYINPARIWIISLQLLSNNLNLKTTSTNGSDACISVSLTWLTSSIFIYILFFFLQWFHICVGHVILTNASTIFLPILNVGICRVDHHSHNLPNLLQVCNPSNFIYASA